MKKKSEQNSTWLLNMTHLFSMPLIFNSLMTAAKSVIKLLVNNQSITLLITAPFISNLLLYLMAKTLLWILINVENLVKIWWKFGENQLFSIKYIVIKLKLWLRIILFLVLMVKKIFSYGWRNFVDEEMFNKIKVQVKHY